MEDIAKVLHYELGEIKGQLDGIIRMQGNILGLQDANTKRIQKLENKASAYAAVLSLLAMGASYLGWEFFSHKAGE